MIYTQPTIYQTFYNATFYSKLNHAYLLVSNQNKLDDKIIKFILNVIIYKKEAFTSSLNNQIIN
ncbi:MAG: hypothetical protein E7Y34_00460, partial [Mycoplasma sp.]|nr:hypothetical protein [Mycoplasma sp.]